MKRKTTIGPKDDDHTTWFEFYRAKLVEGARIGMLDTYFAFYRDHLAQVRAAGSIVDVDLDGILQSLTEAPTPAKSTKGKRHAT